MFYYVLSYFVFESKSAELVHFRDDLGLIRKATVFEKFVRTIEPNIIRNFTIQLNSTNNSRLILKSSFFIMIQNIGQMDQALFCRQERIRLESMNLMIISRRLIFDKKVMELTAVNKSISKNIDEIINKNNKNNDSYL